MQKELTDITDSQGKELLPCPPPAPVHMLQSLLAESVNRSASDRLNEPFPRLDSVGRRLNLSFIHKIVGRGGVIQISLQRHPQRASYAATQLKAVGIDPVTIAATDAACAPQQTLDEGCNQNCAPEEAAIAHSHKRALEVAALRNETWTLILEDDTVPVLQDGVAGSTWDAELRDIWAQLPSNARVVRLSWCWPGNWFTQWTTDTIGKGKMRFTQFGMQSPSQQIWNSVGLCTDAYMVHKDVVPKLLSIFPCNCALDACMGWKFFNSWDSSGTVPMLSYLYNLDMVGSISLIESNAETRTQSSGIMMQAYKQLGTTVPKRAR
jgi:GR25 family glycosyltransferase involved in LPS biosynthesis